MTAIDERLARAALTHVVEPAHVGVALDVAEHGAADAVQRLAGAGVIEHAERSLDLAASRGVRFVIPGDAEWPTQLDDLGDEAPFGLWLRGDANLRTAALRSVGIVGARAATDYGNRVASVLATDLALRGWCVVSGGAYGIDASAHRGALAGQGLTLVVLACGVDVAYPTAHESLFDRCAAHGVLVSEAPPGEPARRWRFLDRNRVIAALSRGTVVVEAARRSGALSTARRAETMGRAVMGVPGPVTSGASTGVHALLRGGATLVASADDILAEVALPADDQVALTSEQEATLAALSARRSTSVERIGATTGRDLHVTLADLTLLELAGLAQRDDVGWRAVG